jgi:hypothetical protein
MKCGDLVMAIDGYQSNKKDDWYYIARSIIKRK